MRDIHFVRTLFYHDGPQVFEARDRIGGHYVGVMAPEGDGHSEDECLVAGVAPERLNQFCDGAVDLRTLVVQSEPDERYIGTFPAKLDGLFALRPIGAQTIDESFLPSPGFVLRETPSEIPNIFQYATGELSQDALLCWLVACAQCSDERLNHVGRMFIETLLRHDHAQVIPHHKGELQRYPGECHITDVGEPRRQHSKIDVYFQATVDGGKVSFVIEDKTDTRMHSNQLQRYREAIATDSEHEDFIKLVYLKTGFVFDDEREAAERYRYVVFDGDDMLAFLDRLGASPHEIVRQFRDHLASRKRERQARLAAWDMTAGFVQWRFMMRLRALLDPRNETMLPARGQSNGGGAWTQYPHWRRRDALYWRLDPARQIRLMVEPKKVKGNPGWWEEWYDTFDQLAKDEGLVRLAFRRRQRHRGQPVAEGTVGMVSLGGLSGDAADLLEKLRRLHGRFLASVGLEDKERLATRERPDRAAE